MEKIHFVQMMQVGKNREEKLGKQNQETKIRKEKLGRHNLEAQLKVFSPFKAKAPQQRSDKKWIGKKDPHWSDRAFIQYFMQ